MAGISPKSASPSAHGRAGKAPVAGAGTGWTSLASDGNGDKKGIFGCEQLAALGGDMGVWAPGSKGTTQALCPPVLPVPSQG